MNTEELAERLADAERVLTLHGKRLEKLEERKTPAPINREAPDDTDGFEETKALLKRHDLGAQALHLYAQIASFREMISKLPRVLPVRHHHHVADRSRGFVIGGIVLLLTVAVSVGLCFGLYRENSRLFENDIKYKMIRQAYPDAALWADSTYHHDSEKAERGTSN